jgi:2-oxoglutarate ferredoxin oxidoreductase subunit beta
MAIAPEQLVKLSGIGCSSKTPAYFVHGAHGFNSVHGRMPSVATGALAGHRDLIAIGVSGDGDSLSIGFGQFGHVIRRNVNMLYLIENNGVYGLTKGQFSASADAGSTSKKGEINQMQNINAVATAISMGASFVGRSFSGDREQLVPLIKAAIAHPGCALLDVISPCVTFNDHDGSTKSYAYTREHNVQATEADLIPVLGEIKASYYAGDTHPVRLHDGSTILLRKVDPDYDPTRRNNALAYLERQRTRGEIVTGLLYIDQNVPDMHAQSRTIRQPLRDLPFERLIPGSAALAELQSSMR